MSESFRKALLAVQSAGKLPRVVEVDLDELRRLRQRVALEEAETTTKH